MAHFQIRRNNRAAKHNQDGQKPSRPLPSQMAVRTFMDLSFFDTGDTTRRIVTSTKTQNAGDSKWHFLNNDWGLKISNNTRIKSSNKLLLIYYLRMPKTKHTF